MKTVFNTAQVAHIWAQGRQEEGQNPARRVYFEGPRLFSYGRHFLTGYRLPDGVAFLNSDKYSVSTSGHQSDARAACPGRYYFFPSLAKLVDLMDSAVFYVPQWVTESGAIVDSAYDTEGRFVSVGQAAPRSANTAELKAFRPKLFAYFAKGESTPVESMAAAFRYAGANDQEATRLAEKAAAAIAKAAQEAKEESDKARRDELARKAKNAAARPLSDTAAALRAEYEGGHYFHAESSARQWGAMATELFRAVKEAKGRGWNRVAKAAKAHESLIRDSLLEFPRIEARRNRFVTYRKEKARIRAALGVMNSTYTGKPLSGHDFRAAASDLESIRRELGAVEFQTYNRRTYRHDTGTRPGFIAPRARLVGIDLAQFAGRLDSLSEAFRAIGAAADTVETRKGLRADVAALKAWKKAGAAADLATAEKAAKVAKKFAPVGAYYAPSIPAPFKVAGFTGAAFRAIHEAAAALASDLKRAEKAGAWNAWRDGMGALPERGAKDAKGGALLRAISVERDDSGAITGGTLQTSLGADCPLIHAIKAFRFLKLCRVNGRAWRANGKTLAVGHFRVDSVDSEGNLIVGCHAINWPEVAALAERLGLADMAGADTTDNREGALA